MASPYKVRNKPSPRPRNIGKVAAFFGVFSLILTGFFLAYDVDQKFLGAGKPSFFETPQVIVKDLGKTYEDLKQQYPGLTMKHDRLGRPVAYHVMDGARFTIWFIAEGNSKQAFRIKADKAFVDIQQSEVLNFFAKTYGRPLDGSCEDRSTSSTQHCHYKWWLQEAISMDLYSKSPNNDTFKFTTVLTNTHLSKKYQSMSQYYETD